jgi:hypothetical protein
MIVDPIRLLRVLERHAVRYVLIGGQAAILHGSPLTTEDVDITPQGDAENLLRLAGALTELEARIRVTSEPEGVAFSIDAKALAANVVWNLQTTLGDLDISFEPSGTGGYDDLARSAMTIRLARGLEVRVASLDDVIRSKQAAGRAKDMAALPLLRELQDRLG